MDAIELLKKARAGDRQARDRMVEENVGLVWNIVKRFNGRELKCYSLHILC